MFFEWPECTTSYSHMLCEQPEYTIILMYVV